MKKRIGLICVLARAGIASLRSTQPAARLSKGPFTAIPKEFDRTASHAEKSVLSSGHTNKKKTKHDGETMEHMQNYQSFA